MWAIRAVVAVLGLELISAAVVPRSQLEIMSLFKSSVSQQLSGKAFIQRADQAPPRWSQFDPPRPAIVVNVASEEDVALVVQFCNIFNIPFLAQNGGVGWATFDSRDTCGVLINLAALNQFTPSVDKTRTTIGGGLSINDTLPAAWSHSVQVETGNCNCVGTLGAYLGGGYGYLMGLYGFGVDNIVSLRVVTPQGGIKTVDAHNDPDLFWAMQGAGPNFGIVTSAVIKSYPVPHSQSFAWFGAVVFDQSKIEDVVKVIGNLKLKPEMNIFFYYAAFGGQPTVITIPWLYQGTKETFRKAFAPLFEIPYLVDASEHVDYKDFNHGGDIFCVRGGFKPSYGAGFNEMIPQTWRDIWNEYVKFQALPGAGNSVVLLEVYSLDKARSVPVSQRGSFAHRDLRFNAVAIPWYSDSSLDAKAQAFGSYVRDQWRTTSQTSSINSTYVNFAFGDESNEVIYGLSLNRLKQLKRKYDPRNVMKAWFNIKA